MKQSPAADTLLSAPGASSTLRVVRVLQELSRHPDIRQAEIAARTGIAAATLHRILSVLEATGFVIREMSPERYRLGPAVADLSPHAYPDPRLRIAAEAPGTQLAKETRETVHVAFWDGQALSYLLKWESPQPLRVGMASSLGASVELHCTSLGKAVLSSLPDEDRSRTIAGLPYTRHTSRTIVSEPELEEELRETARRGFAIDNEENEAGIRCVGAAITHPSGDPLGAISVSAPSMRLGPEAAESLGVRVVSAAADISRRCDLRW